MNNYLLNIQISTDSLNITSSEQKTLSILELISSGGIGGTVIMGTLGLLSIFAVYILFERLSAIKKAGMDNENFLTSDIYIDSGVGFTWEVSRLWSRQINAKPLVLRFDLPIYLNKPQDNENMLSFNRFIFGINRAF